jgi:hypothetical protein
LPGSFPIDYSDGVVKAIKKMQFLAIGAERNQQKKSVVREEQQHSKFATFSSSQSERKKKWQLSLKIAHERGRKNSTLLLLVSHASLGWSVVLSRSE